MAGLGTTVALIKSMGKPDPTVIEQSVSDWLDDHPEATTTVQDGSITKAKLDTNLQETVDDVSDLKNEIDDINGLLSETARGYIVQLFAECITGEDQKQKIIDLSDIFGVDPPYDDIIRNVTGVTVSPASVSLTTEETLQLTATVLPANATDKTVTWSSSDSTVASVSSSGLVTAVAEGTATITVTTTDGGFTATVSVGVSEPAQSTPFPDYSNTISSQGVDRFRYSVSGGRHMTFTNLQNTAAGYRFWFTPLDEFLPILVSSGSVIKVKIENVEITEGGTAPADIRLQYSGQTGSQLKIGNFRDADVEVSLTATTDYSFGNAEMNFDSISANATVEFDYYLYVDDVLIL